MKLHTKIGYKFFKILDDDSVEVIRLAYARKYKKGAPSEVKIINSDGVYEKIRVEKLKEYTPLEPDGYCTFNIATLVDGNKKIHKDVIVTASKFLNLKIGDTMPYAVCRQNITDVFHNLVCTNDNDMMVGLSINQDTCPANFDFRTMMVCNNIEYTNVVNFYRNDNLSDIISLIKESKFDEVLADCYSKHVKATGDPSLNFKRHHKGWCKDLITLLNQNNFESDIDQMLGITTVDFDIDEYIVKSDDKDSVTDDLKLWLSSIYKAAINSTLILEYDHDINLADFNNVRYTLIRSTITNKLYVFVYTVDGEYFESELQKKAEETDFSTKFRINFYNKYNGINKSNSN